jgi:hypothetical protein
MQPNFSNLDKLQLKQEQSHKKISTEFWLVLFSATIAAIATAWFFAQGEIVAYGDAESHLNISKRVIHSLTPGFAQLGGIWLPLPHLLMLPLVYFDSLWRTGLAGSIISGLAFVVSSVYLYKLAFLFTKNRFASIAAAFVFISNPNILYLQATPMTELPLIAFFILSTYYFIRFILSENNFNYLLLAALFSFCATLTRYDGWFLVIIQAAVLGLIYLPLRLNLLARISSWKKIWDSSRWKKLEGHLVIFGSLAFAGILLWLVWGYLILGDPLYFTHSEFSAKSQQQDWLSKGELPAYRNLGQSFLYYTVTTFSNLGGIIFALATAGALVYLFDRRILHRWLVLIILLVPFVFNVVTLFLGQSVIFIPQITPESFDWNLFNVRYGVMMVPFAAFIVGYLMWLVHPAVRVIISLALLVQIAMYPLGISEALSYKDGVAGLSSASAKIPAAQYWFNDNYDHGLVLVDDFARTLSIVRTDVPMQNVIYVGNKPYWEESLEAPEKHARWIIMQKDDQVWKSINDRPYVLARLYKYFEKSYTSPEILVFKRNDQIAVD